MLLLVIHQGLPVLLVDVVGTQPVHKVVAQQIIQRDLQDVLDLLDCVITGELMGLLFQAQFVACRTVGGQIRDDLGVIEVSGHGFQALQ